MNKTINYILCAVLVIIGLGKLIYGALFGGLLLITVGILVFPAISEKIKAILPRWQVKRTRVASLTILAIIGLFSSRTLEDAKLEDKKEIIANYIKSATSDKSISNIRELSKIFEYYGVRNYSLQRPIQFIHKDSVNSKGVFVFNPDLRFKDDDSFLEELKEGKVSNYQVVFHLSEDNKIVSKKTNVYFSNGTMKEFTSNSVPSCTKWINEKKVNSQKEIYLAQQLQNEKRKEYERRKANFEENCLEPFDKSCIALVRQRKSVMHDPDSYNHVETGYRLFKDYAVVTMKYRGKNKLGAKVIEQVSAKIDLKSCDVIEIVQ